VGCPHSPGCVFCGGALWVLKDYQETVRGLNSLAGVCVGGGPARVLTWVAARWGVCVEGTLLMCLTCLCVCGLRGQNFLSAALAGVVRRAPYSPGWLSYTVALCCFDNDDTARSAFAGEAASQFDAQCMWGLMNVVLSALARMVASDTTGVALSLHPRLR
jgi:hypothetical protein